MTKILCRDNHNKAKSSENNFKDGDARDAMLGMRPEKTMG